MTDPAAAAPPVLSPTLRQLAERVGIEPVYHDVYGTRHDASAEATMALLSALGLAAGTEEECQHSLERLEGEAWDRPVPPVLVLRRGQEEPMVPVVVPAAQATAPLLWQVHLEDGGEITGQVNACVVLEQAVRPDGAKARLALPLPLEDLPEGYHRLTVAGASALVVVAPPACWLPERLEQGDRLWGVACQLYSLRSENNWGMGDFADLAALAEGTAARGGVLVGLNPLHALFLSRPAEASPYSPSSRLLLNPLYIAVDQVPEFAVCSKAAAMVRTKSFQARLRQARESDTVDYPAVAALKLPVLQALFATFEGLATDHPRRRAFEAFCTERGERLRAFAVFQVLQEHFNHASWHSWPAAFTCPKTPEVARFAVENAAGVRFHLWLQFEADRQLAEAAKPLRACGAPGLYRDLAVGVNSEGADTWIDPRAYAIGSRVGAPPDPLGPMGQDWGLPPLNPRTLREAEYGPFIDMLRANMRHAGALRIDHAMALQHIFWIPQGFDACHGLYMRYPMDDLMGILALESHRNQCLIIGEDLGTVPEGFRERMAEENILSYRLLYFERWDSGLFKRPEAYPPLSVATPTSHDIATIAGHWTGWDIHMRHRLGLVAEEAEEAADHEARARDRAALLAALEDQGFVLDDPTDLAALITACHRFLARSTAGLMMVNLDDLAVEETQVNVPGTVDQYPNWSRRLKAPISTLLASPVTDATLDALAQEGRAVV